MPHRFLTLADSALTAVAGAASTAVYALGQAAGIPGLEYASFAGLLLLVLYWTQARISYLDKQHEQREHRQATTNAALQEFIQTKMHNTLIDLHASIDRQREMAQTFHDELERLRKAIEAMQVRCRGLEQ